MKILVVEDNAEIRNTIVALLNHEGFKVSFAENGAEALQRVLDGRPDVVVLDLMMPVMSGWEFMERLTTALGVTAPPVVVLSAIPDPAVKNAAYVFEKPINMRRLITKLLEFDHAPAPERSP